MESTAKAAVGSVLRFPRSHGHSTHDVPHMHLPTDGRPQTTSPCTMHAREYPAFLLELDASTCASQRMTCGRASRSHLSASDHKGTRQTRPPSAHVRILGPCAQDSMVPLYSGNLVGFHFVDARVPWHTALWEYISRIFQ